MDLVEAIQSGRLPWLLRDQPELAGAQTDEGVSALLVSRYHRNAEATAALIAAGAPIGPLEAAALGEIALLVDADVTVRSGDGFTPLHLAAYFGGADAVRTLLEAGMSADADAVNPFKVRPIHSACAVGDHASVTALLEAGANPNVQQHGGYTPLHTAAHNGDTALATLLLDHGANASIPDDEGKLPRDLAATDEVRAIFNP